MKRIKQLSKHLINQIAAGEVIERPASVVKELVENSIDADATKVSVEVSNECRDLRIADNGSGIHPDDISLAFSKHATSKIETDEDLFAISTLGFRGEALSSIISIAKLTCTTRTKDFDYGTKVECENSQVKKVQTGCAIGTIMEVKNLFYNLPARLKFLKNPKTEFSYIQELMQSLALAHPQVSFELKNNGKTVLKTTPGDLKNAIKEIYMQGAIEHMKEVLKTDKLSGFKISGFVSTPDYTRSSKKSYHIYINSRMVKCPVFMKSIDTAYKNLIGIGKYPLVVLNLELPPSEIDVNVHPTKKEVRYKNTNQVFNFIYSAIDMALSNSSFAQASEARAITEEIVRALPSKQEENDDVYVSEAALTQRTFFSERDLETENGKWKMENLSLRGGGEAADEAIQKENHSTFRPFDLSTQGNSSQDNIIGQYRNTYILIEKEDGLEIVDQHIAEERYIYEKLKSQKQPASQLLFVSDILQVSASEAELIKENKGKFEKFGYGIEFLKENEIIFKKVPQMLAKANPKELLADILQNLSGDLDNLEEKILITMSCKAAVKAGQRLNLWEMQNIVKNWRTCEKPYTCPHGRPISKFLAHNQIAAFFERQK